MPSAANPHCRQAYAFEPVSQTYNLLRDNIAANGFQTSITPVHAAVSASIGSATIRLHTAHSGAASLSTGKPAESGTVETIQTIDISSVDDMLQPEGEIMVKIDVEGHEAVVISQLMKSRHLPRISAIFYEVNETWNNPAELETTLRGGGFSQFIRHGSGTHYDMLALRNMTNAF